MSPLAIFRSLVFLDFKLAWPDKKTSSFRYKPRLTIISTPGGARCCKEDGQLFEMEHFTINVNVPLRQGVLTSDNMGNKVHPDVPRHFILHCWDFDCMGEGDFCGR